MSNPRSFRLTRRTCLGGGLALGALPIRAYADAAPTTPWVGTYVGEGGAGLVPLRREGAAWRAGAAVAAIRNASFAVRGRTGRRFILDEQRDGGLAVYDPGFARLAQVATLGADPCHVALSPDGAALAVANYSSGSVALWSLDRATGLPDGRAQLVRHEGRGPDAERQAAPHAHWVGFADRGRMLHAVDLGADAIFAHRLAPGASGIADTAIAYRAVPGSGPRHLARHPRLPIAYLVAELANTVTVLRAARDGTFAAQAVVPTLPRGFAGASYAGHIALDAAGTRLYVSNRGHDSVATFAVDARGALTLLGHVGCGGHWPRHLRLFERSGEMLVANQRSGDVARLPLGRDGVPLPPTQVVPVPAAAFVGE